MIWYTYAERRPTREDADAEGLILCRWKGTSGSIAHGLFRWDSPLSNVDWSPLSEPAPKVETVEELAREHWRNSINCLRSHELTDWLARYIRAVVRETKT